MDTVDIETLLDIARTQAELDVRADILADTNIDYVDQDSLEEDGFVRSESTETASTSGRIQSIAVTVKYARKKQLGPPFNAAKLFSRRCVLTLRSTNLTTTHNVKKLATKV